MKVKESKIDIAKVEVGMYWYMDDTFSFEIVAGKKRKAIVELIEKGVIYGDLTASEISDIKDISSNWWSARDYIERFSYDCKKNEKIVWYDVEQLKRVYDQYVPVRKAFEKIGKKYREYGYWTSTERPSMCACYVYFYRGIKFVYSKSLICYLRPVLALKVN